MYKIDIPIKVKKILNTLAYSGFEGFIVGGCVRDSLMGLVPKDWDITTNALPNQIKSLFKHTVDTGLKHGTVTIVDGGEQFEVTTYRLDGEYLDSRRPSSVEFTSNLIEDLRRRDFTINAIAYNDDIGIIDPYHGISDIKEKIIKAVGSPIKRFEEDALRILRAIRFSARFNYEIEENTLVAMKKLSHNLDKISYERINYEFVKTIDSDNPNILDLYYEINAIDAFLKDIKFINRPNYDLIKKSTNIEIKIARLIENIDGIYIDILKKMRFDNKKIKSIISILETKIEKILSEVEIKRLLKKYDIENVKLILKYSKNDEIVNCNIKLLYNILSSKQPYSRSQLAINGNDIIKFIRDKKMVGKILDDMVELIIEDENKNNKEYLIEYIKNI